MNNNNKGNPLLSNFECIYRVVSFIPAAIINTSNSIPSTSSSSSLATPPPRHVFLATVCSSWREVLTQYSGAVKPLSKLPQTVLDRMCAVAIDQIMNNNNLIELLLLLVNNVSPLWFVQSLMFAGAVYSVPLEETARLKIIECLIHWQHSGQLDVLSLELEFTPFVNDKLLKTLVEKLPKLKKLHFKCRERNWPNNTLTDAAASQLAKFSNLQSLSLQRCEALTEEFPKLLCSSSSSSSNLTQSHSTTTKSNSFCSNLTQLELSGATWLKDEGVDILTSSFTNLQNLNLTNCQLLSNVSLEYISSRMSNSLEVLNLSRCPSIVELTVVEKTDRGKRVLPRSPLRKLVRLRELYLDSCFSKNGGLLKSHLNSLPRLEVLSISLPSSDSLVLGISDNDLRHVSLLTNLTSLNLSGNRLCGAGLEYLKPLQNLKRLFLGNCRSISGFELRRLSTSLAAASLEYLDLTAISSVDDHALTYLESMKKLECISVSRTSVTSQGLQDLSVKLLPTFKATF